MYIPLTSDNKTVDTVSLERRVLRVVYTYEYIGIGSRSAYRNAGQVT